MENLDRENSELEKTKKELIKELLISKDACEKSERRQQELEVSNKIKNLYEGCP